MFFVPYGMFDFGAHKWSCLQHKNGLLKPIICFCYRTGFLTPFEKLISHESIALLQGQPLPFCGGNGKGDREILTIMMIWWGSTLFLETPLDRDMNRLKHHESSKDWPPGKTFPPPAFGSSQVGKHMVTLELDCQRGSLSTYRLNLYQALNWWFMVICQCAEGLGLTWRFSTDPSRIAH